MKRTINFSKSRFVSLSVSLAIIVLGVVGTILQGGFNLGIDFQAGLEQQIAIDHPDATAASVREALSDIESVQVRMVGLETDRQFLIRVRDDDSIDNFSEVTADRVNSILRDRFDAVEELGTSYVGPRFSGGLARQVLLIALLALGLILVYIWFRFRLGFAVSAIVALVHDLAIMSIFIGLFRIEVSTATVAAVLTIIGYSLNDTIVIFDRIRENELLLRESAFRTIVDASITQSLSRTVITSVTTLLAVVSIYLFTTGNVRNFALNMIVGVVVGTYSSIFIASPTLMFWNEFSSRRRQRRERVKFGAQIAPKQTEQTAEAAPATGAVSANASLSIDVEAVKREISIKRANASKRSTTGKKRRKR